MLSIDDIYDLFLWDASYSDEEYAAREKLGVEEASKLKNLYPFIQPVIMPPHKSKSVWEPCAKVIALKADEELIPFLGLLFEWLQDMNWPGAGIVYNRLSKIPFANLEAEFRYTKHRAEKDGNETWLLALSDFGNIYNEE